MTTAMEVPTEAHEAPRHKRVGEIHAYDTNISVWEEGSHGGIDEPGMRLTFRAMLGRLHTRGFTMDRDPRVLRNHPSIANGYWRGRKGDLEFRGETCGRTAKIEFFQNVANVENRNGGEFDHEKLSRMPRSMRLACIVEMLAVTRKLLSIGYTLGAKAFDPRLSLQRALLNIAEDYRPTDPLEHFNKRWEPGRFKRDASGWPTYDEYSQHGSNDDRDKQPIRNGEVRYFRYRGRLMRGVAYTNMGNMWAVHSGLGIQCMASYELFSCERPDLLPRRHVPRQVERLKSELEKATKAEQWSRVATLARILHRAA